MRRGFARFFPLSAAAAAAVGALALSQGAWAAHIKLTPADDFARIVESAKDGDVIELAPGLYKKKLMIRAAITLKGPRLTDDKDRLDAKKAAVIDARGRGSGITVDASPAAVSAMTG